MTARFRDKAHAIKRRVYRLGTVFEFGANNLPSTPVRLARVAGFNNCRGNRHSYGTPVQVLMIRCDSIDANVLLYSPHMCLKVGHICATIFCLVCTNFVRCEDWLPFAAYGV